MAFHQPLELLTFVQAVPPELLDRYFAHFPWEQKPEGWSVINGDALAEFLDRPENEEFRGVVLEQFRRMNDICAGGAAILLRAYERARLPIKEASMEQLALELFLDGREDFEYAWSRYLLYGGSPKLSIYRLATTKPIHVTNSRVATMALHLEQFFSSNARGGKCKVKFFDDRGEAIIMVSRGKYLRTVACWQQDQIGFTSFRPASEDILVYDSARRELEVKASLEGERLLYLQLFATHVAGDRDLADKARNEKLFSLTPIQKGTFDYSGDGEVTKVDLVSTLVKSFDDLGSSIQLRSRDVVRAIQRRPQYSLTSGDLTEARLRFHLQPVGERKTTVTFDLQPPLRTDLAQKRYADIIERYLVREGVKLA